MSGGVGTLLRAAADRVELTPPEGGRLGGFGSRFEALEGSLDPLHARIVLLEQDGTHVLWVSCDLLGFSTALDREFRARVSSATLIPPTHIFISCTHTHSAPVGMSARGPSGLADDSWIRSGIFDRVATSAAKLGSKLRPVAEIKTGTTLVGRLGYNRQDSECPIDERVVSLALVGNDGRAIASIVNYALHPVVIGETNLKCSADFPGYASSRMEERLGGVALFINGSCGDVDPVNYRDHGRHSGSVEMIRDMGHAIADAAIASLRQTEQMTGPLCIESMQLTIPLDPAPSKEQMIELRDHFADASSPHADRANRNAARGAMFQLVWAEELLNAIKRDSVPTQLMAEVSAIQIGPVFVVTCPFEIYSQIGLEIRKQLAPRSVIIAAYTGGLIGYVVTTLAKQQGGYGAALSHRYFPELLTAIGTGADQRLVEAGIALVNAIYSKNQERGD